MIAIDGHDINYKITGNGPETVLLPAAPEYLWFSSTMAREMIRYGQDLRKYLPSAVAEEIIKGIEDYGEQ